MKLGKKAVTVSICIVMVFTIVLVNQTKKGKTASDMRVVSGTGVVSDSDMKQKDKGIFNTNKYGETYGETDPDSGEEPDLMAVIATNGKEGYIKKKEFDEKAGGNVSSPEEAIEYEKRTAGKTIKLPVYNKDGDIVIGFFELSSGRTEETE